MSGKNEQGNGHGDHHPQWFFFVGKEKYSAPKAILTGAEIMQIAGAKAGEGLMLEGQGNDPDKVIGETETIDVSQPQGRPSHFRLVPPAAFG